MVLNPPKVFVLLLCLCLALATIPPQNPVIGIYTQDFSEGVTYIVSSYVKYLEMSGAQVIPLFHTLTKS
jgi:hypothetical protein